MMIGRYNGIRETAECYPTVPVPTKAISAQNCYLTAAGEHGMAIAWSHRKFTVGSDMLGLHRYNTDNSMVARRANVLMS